MRGVDFVKRLDEAGARMWSATQRAFLAENGARAAIMTKIYEQSNCLQTRGVLQKRSLKALAPHPFSEGSPLLRGALAERGGGVGVGAASETPLLEPRLSSGHGW